MASPKFKHSHSPKKVALFRGLAKGRAILAVQSIGGGDDVTPGMADMSSEWETLTGGTKTKRKYTRSPTSAYMAGKKRSTLKRNIIKSIQRIQGGDDAADLSGGKKHSRKSPRRSRSPRHRKYFRGGENVDVALNGGEEQAFNSLLGGQISTVDPVSTLIGGKKHRKSPRKSRSPRKSPRKSRSPRHRKHFHGGEIVDVAPLNGGEIVAPLNGGKIVDVAPLISSEGTSLLGGQIPTVLPADSTLIGGSSESVCSPSLDILGGKKKSRKKSPHKSPRKHHYKKRRLSGGENIAGDAVIIVE